MTLAANLRHSRAGGRLLLTALALVLATAAVYAPTARHEFLNYDDDVYILANPEVTGGLSWSGFLWAFSYHARNWHPLTWLSHMFDCQVFGLWAGGHHLVGAGIHAVNALLLLAVLSAMTGAFWRSAVVAAFFSLHPLRVESVAWAAERKDLLSALFWFLTIGAYLWYVRRPGRGRYLAALGLFALGLTAKPMIVTLPLVLLLLDGWPLGRNLSCGGNDSPLTAAADRRRGAWHVLILEKTPFLMLSLVASLITWWGQTHNVVPLVNPGWTIRLGNAALSLVLYLKTSLWPCHLAPLYPYPRSVSWVEAGAAALLLVLITVAVFVARRRHPYLGAGWFWYLVTILPVIGLVQVGAQARSDRYTYLTLTGVFVAQVWFVADLWPRQPWARRGLAAGIVAALAALTLSSAAYVRVWKDNLSLFEYTTRETRDNYIFLNNLAGALDSAGRSDEAVRALEEAVRINPDYCEAHLNLGSAFARRRRYRESLEPFDRALACYERKKSGPAALAEARARLGTVEFLLGRFALAEQHFRELLKLKPDDPNGRLGLAEALSRQGKNL